MENVEWFVSPKTGEKSFVYRVATKKAPVGCVLSFHGGSFTGGSTEFDKEQNMALAKRGLEVHQVSFPRTTFADFIEWATADEMRDFLQQQHKAFGGSVFVLGRSSGGFLAKFFYEHYSDLIAKAIYLCPVLQPVLRAQLVPKTRESTARYFANTVERNDFSFAKRFCAEREMIMVVSHDDRVPLECFSDEQKMALRVLHFKTHRYACTCATDAFLRQLTDFLI